MATGTRLTIDQFLDSDLAHEKPYRELVRGEPIAKMSPTGRHQNVEFELALLFAADPATAAGVGRPELHIRFDVAGDERLLVPDFAFYADRSRYSLDIQTEPPDLVVEVRSPGQSLALLREKARYYLAHGVTEVWLIDPRGAAALKVAADGESALDRGDTLEFGGISIPLSRLLDLD